MFGVLVAGRLVKTDFQQVDETHAIFNLEDADNINHIVVMLTGAQAFPSNDFGGAVSAAQGSNPFCSSLYVSHMAQIGISIEPLSQIVGLTPPVGTKATEIATFAEFAKKMVENFMNFASSFALKQSDMQPNPSESYVPASVVQQWVTTFQRRFETNPYFWKS